MSDQQPPKPKPGSMRDRIAAFEKSATAPTPVGPAPVPRPKPQGFASWKPKAPSPPSSPSSKNIDHATPSLFKSTGSMSASDAKESITKGGSLKERMAALQVKGAFGASAPPLAPKPAVEKPRWKPPPVVAAPVDDDDGDNPTGNVNTAIAAAADGPKSPPVVKSRESLDLSKPIAEGEETSTAEPNTEPNTSTGGDVEESIDPEEEARQRRAAIAARMARLGGARIGMAPPVVAKKPSIPVRKLTREDVPKQEDREEVPERTSLSLEERGKNIEENIFSSPILEGIRVASPPSFTDSPHIQSQLDNEEHLPVRTNSQNASVDSTDSSGTRSPPSMPVPTVPRRAGPPRKKPAKPTAAPPEVPENRVEEVDATPPSISTIDKLEREAIETHAITPEHEDWYHHQEIKDYQGEIHDEPQSIDSNVQHEPAEELVVESEPASSGESKEQEFSHEVQPPSLATIELKRGHEHAEQPDHPEDVDAIPEDQPEDVGNYSEDEHSDYEENHVAEHHEQQYHQPKDDDEQTVDYTNEHSDHDDNYPTEHHENQHLQQNDDHVDVDAEPQPSSAAGVTGTEEDEDAAEEEARRKRVAERLAKMGGINPFAASPLYRSSEETGHTSPPAVSSHASPPSVALPMLPSRVDISSRKASLPSSHEVVEPHPPPVVESKEEQGGEEDHSDEIEDGDSDYSGQGGSFEEIRAHEEPMELFSPQHRQQVDATPRQLPDSSPRPPVPDSARPQVQQYGRHDAEQRDTHLATRHLSPPSRLPALPVSHKEASLPPARPAQPPRRIVPQAPEEQEEVEEEEEEEEEAGTDDDEGDERLVPSHLFVRPLQPRDPVSQSVRRGQRYEADEDEDSENDTLALPVLQRRSQEVPPGRSLPPPLPSAAPPSHLLHRYHLSTFPSDISEPDSDHDGQALPIRPRHIAVPPTPPMSVQVPPPTPRRSVPSFPPNEESFSSPYGTPSVAISEPESGEILDEEEGDPIDPAFHSPSRRSSMGNVRGSAHDDASGLPVQAPSHTTPVLPVNVEKREEAQQQEEQGQTKRQTIAERMAKLGGIKFGAAPIPAAMLSPPPPPPPPLPQGLDEEGGHHPEHHPQEDAEDVEQPVEFSEEEEERARKERIAAKLAGMGGMRIGMMPMGMGPQRAHVLRDENVAPPSPTRAVPPPVRPPPPPTRTRDTDSDRISDDGVKVEAEESEIEEVDYEDVVEELEETTPPPSVPSRGGRVAYRRESAPSPSSPLIPGHRPPVPVALPTRRSSVQTAKSAGSVDFGFSPSQATSSHLSPQSEYVIVDEPHSFEEVPPPSRRTSRAPPARPSPIPTGIPQASDHSISSQWELPSIPTAALDFGSGADLSLSSWTDAGEPSSKQPTGLSSKPKTVLPSELQLSADDLMRVWGRVGVQVCEVATSLFDNSKKTLVGDGSYAGFLTTVLAGVPNAAPISVTSREYGYLVYAQNGSSVQKRVSEILPGDIVEIHEGKFKGHKGLHTYHQNVGGSGESLLGIVGEFEAKKLKIRVFHANQHVGQQTVESVSYRLEDLKSGTVKVYRVLEE